MKKPTTWRPMITAARTAARRHSSGVSAAWTRANRDTRSLLLLRLSSEATLLLAAVIATELHQRRVSVVSSASTKASARSSAASAAAGSRAD